jgi:hypothetical protein
MPTSVTRYRTVRFRSHVVLPENNRQRHAERYRDQLEHSFDCTVERYRNRNERGRLHRGHEHLRRLFSRRSVIIRCSCYTGICLLEWSTWSRLTRIRRVDAAAFLVTSAAVLTMNAVAAVALGCSLYVFRYAYRRVFPRLRSAGGTSKVFCLLKPLQPCLCLRQVWCMRIGDVLFQFTACLFDLPGFYV